MVQFAHDRANLLRNLYRTHRKEKFRYHPDLTGVDFSDVYEAMNEDLDWLEKEGWIRRSPEQTRSYVLTEKGWQWAEEHENLGLR